MISPRHKRSEGGPQLRHGTDLTYEARDLVAPMRCGLRRQDWRDHAKAIRDIAEMGGDDHAMARAMKVNRKQMLAYASEVPQFASELYTSLRIAKTRTRGKTQSITWARRKVAWMRRWRERAEPLPLPRFICEPPATNTQPTPTTVEELADILAANGDELAAAYLRGYDETASSKENSDPDPATAPDSMRPEDWEMYAIQIIRIGCGGGDDYSMAAELRVSRSSMLQFAAAVTEFNEALMYARTLSRAWWDSRMREAIYRKSGLVGSVVCRGHDWINKSGDTSTR